MTWRALSISPSWQDSLSYKDSLDVASNILHRPHSELARMSRNLALEMVRVTESAAVAGARWMGKVIRVQFT
jgi:hypothetical protein